MRKLLVTLSLVTTASTAFATDLNCTVKKPLNTPNETVSSFTLTNIEGGEFDLKSSLPDQNTLVAFELKNGLVTAGFSNECDNDYSVKFKAEKFALIKSGTQSKISGKVSYTDADEGKSTSKIDCVVKK